ncbi:peptidoglycan/LPS O-acetylase OafA/YrhL [Mumia flava]|uniref:Peptidoglycan/LPS O-acetylase OafA/YrhL n=1 Tax=Mumia flava TaxID=1348852 RepID=A0A2M9BJ76_9ACTN|nr:acyltransferase family protein [Mumia flava]PJJ58003.1 peptidoglycan/LPS O-acetylase OafA/YrhL [Mumia flava]
MSFGRPTAPGLDGVRAVAVLLVVAYHVAPAALPGGYAGVDVFFVLSGFLITTLLLAEAQREGRVDLPGFWVRRLRRLVPAAATLVIAVAALTVLVGRDTGAGLKRQVLGGVTWTSNWLQVADGWAYADAGEPPILNHLWSLAIEEQYYLLWPVVLVLMLRVLRRRGAAVLALVLGGASAVAMAWTFAPDAPTRAYMGTDTHVFGLLLGSALALSGAANLLNGAAPAARPGRWLTWVGAGGLVLVAGYTVLVPWTSPVAYRGGLLLVSVAVCGVVLAAANRTPLARALAVAPLRWVGQRSYGIYLWHWPLVVAAVRIAPPERALAAGLVAVAAAVAVADVSYRLVELPMRRDGIGATLRGWAAAVRRPSPGPAWSRGVRAATAVGVGAVVVTASVGVTRAPERSGLEASLARGEAALAGMTTQPGSSDGSRGAGSRASRAGARPATCRTVGRQVPVSAFGDSVLIAAAPALAEVMPRTSARAKVGWQYADVAGAVRSAAREGNLGRVVVIGTGTNGLIDTADLDRLVRRTLAGRTVVLMTPYVPGRSWQRGALASVRTVARRNARVVLAPWHAAVAGRDALLSADRVHPNERGARLYVRTLRESLGGC